MASKERLCSFDRCSGHARLSRAGFPVMCSIVPMGALRQPILKGGGPPCDKTGGRMKEAVLIHEKDESFSEVEE